MVLLLAYPFLVATFQYVATALAFLHGMICSSVKAVQALLRLLVDKRRAAKATPSQAPVTTAAIKATVLVAVLHEYDDLRRRAQSSTARRRARKAAKAAAAPMNLRRSSRLAARKTLRRSPRLAKKA